ncbi:hypothetical protein PISMIDRAFT_8185 [Pisolithus microcarpus 441]|uniref:DUF6830 domain-containing protein n=1 Tax=Pisolithus microcarpus 441 TaxID=765257 RepID=A0A0D0A5K5_9AGAM|nr:hypothetical protein BKA83DRAFT_8185 [Pisolithus microcarpus]KIK27343.1 hypothetical protein PISMIDRAFT_8185 [Pisolithus microcarpus 441]
MNQPSSACSALLNDIPRPTIPQPLLFQAMQTIKPPYACQGSPSEAVGDVWVDFCDVPYDDRMDIQVDDMLYDDQDLDLQHSPSGPGTPSVGKVEYFPGTSQCYPGGRTFMDNFFSDEHSELCKDNLFYPFTSQQDWQVASWLLCSRLSMAAIDSFLSLDWIKELPLSFRTARELHLRAELLPSAPHWHSQVIRPQHPTKQSITLFYRDPIECIQSLLSHPLFESHVKFVPRKVWSTAAQLSHVYDEWLTGEHAWNLQASSSPFDLDKELPEGGTLLGIVLSSDKTNISVMSGNHMAHPLLLSLANIATDIHSKGSLHGHLLLALLPVPSFIHRKSRIRSLLSDQLFHHCLDLILTPLKIAATVGVMMNDPHGNLRYCYTPLVGYIVDTPEQSLLACTSPRTSSMSTATYKEFGDDKCHDPRTAEHTLNTISALCSRADADDLPGFLKVEKPFGLNGVHEPFWRDRPLLDPAQFLKVEPLHHFFRMSWDHDIQWCITVVRDNEIDFRFNLLQMPVGYHSFADGISKLKQVTGHDHHSIQQYILCVVAGMAPPRFLAAICALLDFCYLAQMPIFDEQALAKLNAALASFHTDKHAILAAGGCSEHFQIPKLKLMQHVVPSIRTSGAPMQWSVDVTKHAHVTEVKNPARAGNNQNYYAQIACHLDRSDECFRFDLATNIASSHDLHPNNGGDPTDEDHEPDDEKSHNLLYHSPIQKIVDYFKIADVLANGISHNAPCPTHMFASSTTAIHLTTKPHCRMTVDEAVTLFDLPDLLSAICDCFNHCANSIDHDISGRRCASLNYSLPSNKIQVWAKVHMQV